MDSQPLETASIAKYFSYLPVHRHSDATTIQDITLATIDACAHPGSKEYSQAKYRHPDAETNPYALCHPKCDLEKLKFFVKVVEMIWIDDDITEELVHEEALQEHEILRQALDTANDADTDTGKTVGEKKQFLRDARGAMLRLDPIGTPALLKTLDTYLKEYDQSDEDFTTLEAYLPYRIPNAGFRVCCHFTRWSMDISLTPEETERVQEFEWTLGGVLALTNDLFSWKKERHQKTDRIRNAIPLLMKQLSLGESESQALLKGIIVGEEEKARYLKQKLQNGGMSSELQRYVDALELYVGGNAYWSAICIRYNDPQETK